MQIAPEQGQFLHLLTRLLGAKRCLEIGTFTGYSAAWMALALPAEGHLICCERNAKWSRLAHEHWTQAGLAERIELRQGEAAQTLAGLLAEDAAGSFDLVFIDADKTNYPLYYESALELIRPGGLIAVDNVLWGGSVIDNADTDPDTEAIRAFNRMLHADARVDLSLVPIGDGLALARKR